MHRYSRRPLFGLPVEAACRVLGLSCCLAVLTGCQSEVPRYAVTGVLKIDGQPVPQGMKVVFTPEGPDATSCVGATNDSGAYVMYHKPGMKGIFAGKYTVSIAMPGDEGAGFVMLPPTLADIKIPDTYRTGKSTLTCDVPQGGTIFDIDVTTK